MATRRVHLRTIRESDGPFLYDLMSSPEAGGRVRFAGATPSPEQVRSTLWESVLAQFVVVANDSGHPKGLVAITSPNFRDGFAYMSALATPTAQRWGIVIEGVVLAFNYAFNAWPFRKLYMEATDTSYRSFRSGLNELFVQEGRLKDHVFWNGAFVDLNILAVYRETWSLHTGPMLKRMGTRGASPPSSPSSGLPAARLEPLPVAVRPFADGRRD